MEDNELTNLPNEVETNLNEVEYVEDSGNGLAAVLIVGALALAAIGAGVFVIYKKRKNKYATLSPKKEDEVVDVEIEED